MTRNKKEVYAGMLKGCKNESSLPIPSLPTNPTEEHGISFRSDEMTCEEGTEITCTELVLPTKSAQKSIATDYYYEYI